MPQRFAEPGVALLDRRAGELAEVPLHVDGGFLDHIRGPDLDPQVGRKLPLGEFQELAASRLKQPTDGIGRAAPGAVDQLADIATGIHDQTG